MVYKCSPTLLGIFVYFIFETMYWVKNKTVTALQLFNINQSYPSKWINELSEEVDTLEIRVSGYMSYPNKICI